MDLVKCMLVSVFLTRKNSGCSSVCQEPCIQDKVGVASVVDKIREARLRWFNYVKRRCTGALVIYNLGQHKIMWTSTFCCSSSLFWC